jgi:hypothetical protein
VCLSGITATQVFVEPASEKELNFRFVITGKGDPPEEAFATLQLVLRAGETLMTAKQKIMLSANPIHLLRTTSAAGFLTTAGRCRWTQTQSSIGRFTGLIHTRTQVKLRWSMRLARLRFRFNSDRGADTT